MLFGRFYFFRRYCVFLHQVLPYRLTEEGFNVLNECHPGNLAFNIFILLEVQGPMGPS